MSKYNTVIHILFWNLVAVLICIGIAAVIALTQNGQLDPFLIKEETKVATQREPVYITTVEKIKEEIEWFYFVATGYSANDPEQGTNNITATGKEIKKSMIAVDPKIIPLGTEVEIRGMGVFTAEDIGGKIKGNRIDIYFEDKEDAKDFGRQVIWIRVLNSRIELLEFLHK